MRFPCTSTCLRYLNGLPFRMSASRTLSLRRDRGSTSKCAVCRRRGTCSTRLVNRPRRTQSEMQARFTNATTLSHSLTSAAKSETPIHSVSVRRVFRSLFDASRRRRRKKQQQNIYNGLTMRLLHKFVEGFTLNSSTISPVHPSLPPHPSKLPTFFLSLSLSLSLSHIHTPPPSFLPSFFTISKIQKTEREVLSFPPSKKVLLPRGLALTLLISLECAQRHSNILHRLVEKGRRYIDIY